MTNWTQKQYAELNKKVAEKFDIEKFKISHWHTIMELCVEHNVFCDNQGERVICHRPACTTEVLTADHNNDKSLTERVARCLALLGVLNEI